jgi:hypothetical protein
MTGLIISTRRTRRVIFRLAEMPQLPTIPAVNSPGCQATGHLREPSPIRNHKSTIKNPLPSPSLDINFPRLIPNVQTFRRSNVPTPPCSNASTSQPSIFNFQPSTEDICSSPTAFVPQTTNVQNLPIIHNSSRKQSLKSQESDLFLEKSFLNFFYSKIPPCLPPPVVNYPSSTVHRPSSASTFNP